MATATDAVALPPEVAARGEPKQVVNLADGKISGQRLFLVVGGFASFLACLVIAIPLFVNGVKPFGRNAPPPGVSFIAAGVLATLGLLMAYAAYHYAFGRFGGGSYHFFDDALVVVAHDNTARVIPWERVQPEKKSSSLNPRHAFPVEGEGDLTFDFLAVEHAVVAAAIARQATLVRWSGVIDLARLSTERPAPAFLVHDPSDTGLYRVSLLLGKLLFARVGDGSAQGTRGFPARPVHTQGGLAGGMAAWMQMKQIEKIQQELDKLEGLDERRLIDAAAGLAGTRLVEVGEMTHVRFTKPGTWDAMSTGVKIVAVLRFTHDEWGEKKLYLESLTQVGDAARILQDVLGQDFRAEAMQVACG